MEARRSTKHSNSLEVDADLDDYKRDLPHNHGEQKHQQQQRQRHLYSSGTDTTDLSESERSNANQLRTMLSQIPSTNRLSPTMVVRPDETPARRLILKMVDLQESLSDMNRRIMSGQAVPEDEWERVRAMSYHLSTSFQHEVQFAWEADLHDIAEGSEAAATAADDQVPFTSTPAKHDDVEQGGATDDPSPEEDSSYSSDSDGSCSRMSL